jgi:serine/threonine protein kinase/tetratricopeptide (TPR) repeat protein
MSSSQHERATELFLKLCDLPPDEQEAMLDEACASDPALRAEVELWLAHDQDGSRMLPTRAGAEAIDAFLRDDRISSTRQIDATSCAVCSAPIPPGQSECPGCATKTGVTTIRIPGFKIVRLLGRGGMGEVYLADETALDRRVAIKIISKQLAANERIVNRFKREARMMAAVEHPNIVHVYSLGQTDGQLFLVLEYVEGESLAERLRRVGRLSTDEALRILHQTLEALNEAWGHRIVHRDIKPSNILLDKQDRARVADFGLARTTKLEDDAGITRMGEMVGTPRYVSPEQACGSSDVDFRTDVYSLGIVTYEMLTGKVPFDGPSGLAIAVQHLHTPLPSLTSQRPEVAGELELLCEWMTRKQPSDRPESYEQLLDAVEALLGGDSPDTGKTSPPLIPGLDVETHERPPFVGRERELESLNRLLEQALEGQGQIVLVTGEAGSGKTALIDEFARTAQEDHDDLIVARGNCDAQTGIGDPYLPFREVLGLLTGDVESKLASGSINRNHARRLWSLLPLAVQALVERGPDLLDTFVPGTSLVSRAKKFTPAPARWRVRLEELARRNAGALRGVKLQQSDLFEQYTRMLQTLAARQPIMLQLEDLHWVDRGSCSLLFHLGRRIAGSRVLILCTYRPADVEREPAGQRHPLKSVVHELQRQVGDCEIQLGEQGTREFIDALLDDEPNRLSVGFRDALYRQTQGHPLFTVELLRTMRENGMLTEDEEGRWIEGQALEWGALPARVEGAIGERLSHLPEDLQKVLSLASVQGEYFVAEVLAEMHGTSSREMIGMLSRELSTRHRLVGVQGVTRVDGQRISTYRFRHNSFQTYLYGQMDDAERSYLHEETGTALEALHGEHTAAIAVQLAWHFRKAEIHQKAIPYLRQAGEQAGRLSANDQAITHLHDALELLATTPDTPERAREELTLQLALGAPLLATVGPTSAELTAVYKRALELCEQVGDEAQLFQTLLILVHHHASQGELEKALQLAEQMLQVAESAEEPLPAIMAYWARGFALNSLTKLAEARDDFDRVVSLHDPSLHSSLAYVYGVDPAASALAYNGQILWVLGFPEQALESARRAVALAREGDHPTSLAHALCQSTGLANSCGDLESLLAQNEELIRLSTKEGIVPFRNWATLDEGWVRVWQGQHEEGIERMREGLAAMRASGARHALPGALARLAEAHWKAGQPEEGLTALSEALSLADKTYERAMWPEFLRLRGELLLASGSDGAAEAEAEFRKAIEIARESKSKSWELRATISLSRLLQTQGERGEARQRLAEIYGWFTEGFETRDLKDAKALLDALC